MPVVEDAAQAHGRRPRRRAPGALGDAATSASTPRRTSARFGDAGAVPRDDHEIADKVADAALPRLPRQGAERSATTRASTSCRPRSCGCCCRTSTTGPSTAAPRRRRYADSRPGEMGRPAPADSGRRPGLAPLRDRTDRSELLERALPEAGIGARSYYRVPVHRQPAMASSRRRAAAGHRGGRPHPPRHPHQRSDHPRAGAARSSARSPDAHLGRPDQQPARARPAPGRRAAARGGARRAGHGARLRPDGRAVPRATGWTPR